MYYVDMHKRYFLDISKAKAQALEGANAYKGKNYQEASTRFFTAIKLLVLCVLNSNPDLAAAYFNYGRSLQQLCEYERAIMFLKKCLQLREHYTQPKPPAEQIAKTRAALLECESSVENIKPACRAASRFSM